MTDPRARTTECRSDSAGVHRTCTADEDGCGCSCHRYESDLRRAWELLARASTWARGENVAMLSSAIERIAYVGSDLPGWSKHMQPLPVPDPKSGEEAHREQ